MKVEVVKDYEQLSMKAALFVAGQIISNPESVLGLATGSTPLGMYDNLVEMNKKGWIDFSRVTTFNLDEYLGLDDGHVQSYNYYMHKNLFKHIKIDEKNINIPPANPENIEKACTDYEEKISEAGGIDLQILGLGRNGHIGFNEPSSALNTETHVVRLKEKTIEDNSRFFESIDQVPTEAISMGVGSIMKASKLLLLASGEKKAEAVAQMIKGRVSTKMPASLLQVHRNLNIIIDEEAAGYLNDKI